MLVRNVPLYAIWVSVFLSLAALALGVQLAIAMPSFVPANQPIGYVAQDELTSYHLRSGHEILFRAQFERESWSGNLLGYRVNGAGGLDAATQAWPGGAAKALAAQGSARRIVTMGGDNGARIPFAWESLSAAQQSSLGGRDVLDFLRGVRTGEIQNGGRFRQRAAVLGAIIHSRPIYVGDGYNPDPASTEVLSRPTVFVGANDGMLHAFDVRTGEERWAYVPSMLIPKLRKLAFSPYAHDYYADGGINVATLGAGSRRVLVGALGAGGKGLYALDISGRARLAPVDEATAASNILWEITPTTLNNAPDPSYANLGFTYANPTITRVLVNGTSTDAVIVGNGYGNTGDYQAHLYVINAHTGALIHAVKAGNTGHASSPNGLSTPSAIDSDGDGNADTVYAGDLNGTMWKFVLANTPVATALLTVTPAQPITMTPGVAMHPSGGYMVNFATGSILTSADAADTQSVFAAYGVWDGAPLVNTDLLSQTLTERCYTSGLAIAASPCADRVFTVTANAPDWTPFVFGAAHHKGWKVPLPAGYRVVGDGSFIESGRFYFAVYNPVAPTNLATVSLEGESWLLELDYLSGGVKNAPFMDLNGNRLIDSDDRVKSSAIPPVPVATTDGVPVGRRMSAGVSSQPILVQSSTLNSALFNTNSYANAIRAASTADGSVSVVSADALGISPGQRPASLAGSLTGGAREQGLLSRVGRVSWRELAAP